MDKNAFRLFAHSSHAHLRAQTLHRSSRALCARRYEPAARPEAAAGYARPSIWHFREPHETRFIFIFQIWNMIESLRAEESPFDLVRRSPVLVARKHGNTTPTSLEWNEWYKFKKVNYANRHFC